MTLKSTTQLVTVAEEHLQELQQWVNAKQGQMQPWNKIVGAYGTLDRDENLREIVDYARLEVAQQQPEMRLPRAAELPAEIADDLIHMAVDSYDWIHESRFDEVDMPRVMEAIRPALFARGDLLIPDRDAKMDYLRQHASLDDLPAWEQCTPAQKALIQEAFDESNEWQISGSLHSDTLNALTKRMRPVN